MRSRDLLLAAWVASCALVPSVAEAQAFQVCVHDALARVRREVRVDDAACAGPARMQVLRGETFAAQISVRARGPLTVGDVRSVGDAPLEIFAEHFVDVPKRSRTGDGLESLGFTAEARGTDADYVGALPDALVPLADAPAWLHPKTLAPNERAVFFVEAFVPEDEPASTLHFAVAIGANGEEARIEFTVDVAPRTLPFRPVKALAYYEHYALERAFGDDANDVERSLAQLLHAHRLDSFTRVTNAAEASRVRGSFDGSWFDARAGHRGGGAGIPTEVFVLGAYGRLGDPTDEAVEHVEEILAEIPPNGPSLRVLYAVDETCDSPRGAVWKSRLRDAGIEDVEVLHTCHELPSKQPVDITAMPGQSFDWDLAEDARAAGKRVWVYNGQLPHAGAPNLDVPLPSLAHNGWLSALHDVDHWFYWETTFWEDIYKGGKGPHDPFATAETFHNHHGDTSLYDGLLVFPGRVPKAVGTHDLGRSRVYPSLRLKALRRGIEDAGLLALAADVDARRTHEIAREVIVAGFDEVDAKSPALFQSDPARLAAARSALRQIVLAAPSSAERPDAVAARGLTLLHKEHRDHRWLVGAGQPIVQSRFVTAVLMPAMLLGFGVVLVLLLQRSRGPRSDRATSKTW